MMKIVSFGLAPKSSCSAIGYHLLPYVIGHTLVEADIEEVII